MRKMTMALAAVAALGLAACGGASPEQAAHTPAKAEGPSKADYMAQMEEICEQADERGDELTRRAEQAEKMGNTERAVETLREGMAEGREFTAELRALDVPAGEREFHRAYLRVVADKDDVADKLVDAWETDDFSAYSTYGKEMGVIKAEMNAVTAGHGGFTHCGHND